MRQEFYIGYPEDWDYFTFTLKTGTRVLKLHTKDDYKKFCDKYAMMGDYGRTFDWVKVAQEYDVIDYRVNQLYVEMYGWDCDCICVLNKEVMEVKEIKQ